MIDFIKRICEPISQYFLIECIIGIICIMGLVIGLLIN